MISSQLVVGGLPKERIKAAQKIIRPFFNAPIDFENPPIDVLIIRPDDSISINQIRGLKRFLSLRPYQAKTKIGLILEAEKLTLPAQNSLLKTLEEPPANSLIVLLASQSESLLLTIISRVKTTRLPARSQISLLENEEEELIRVINRLLTQKTGERLKISLVLIKDKYQALTLVEQFLFLWRKFLLVKTGVGNESIRNKQIINIVNKLTLGQIARAIKNTEQIRKMLLANVNFHLAIENLFLSYPYFKLALPKEK